VKYHGLRDRTRRIPFHDSISVCVENLTTRATIEFDATLSQDSIEINGTPASKEEAARVLAVVSPIRKLARAEDHFRLASVNSLAQGKGLGFSASAFASISLASAAALGVKVERERLSEIARLGAGSASRSLAGGFAIWYANRKGRSYATEIPSPAQTRLSMGIIPVSSQIKTDTAHEESVSSPFFQARVKEVRTTVPGMLRAIHRGDIDEIGRLAEADSLSLHAVTMTGKSRLLLMAPETICVIREVLTMRETDHIPVWYSLDTGPSVYVNTYQEFIDTVCSQIERNLRVKVLKSGVGGPASITDDHLF
jgi:phosphomevalonate decarboxylase